MFLLKRRKAKLKSAEKPDRREVRPSRTNKRGPAKSTAPASSASKGKDRWIEQTDTGRPLPLAQPEVRNPGTREPEVRIPEIRQAGTREPEHRPPKTQPPPSAQPETRTQFPPPEPPLRRSERTEARQPPKYVNDDHLPEGVDSYGNPDPKYPHKITPEERSLLKIINGDTPDVDWIADGAGYPAFRPINTAPRIRAALGQRIGTIARDENGEPCERCTRDIGPFQTCRTFNLGRKVMFSGSCMSCAFSNCGNRCTLRAGKKRPTVVKDPHVTADGAISKLEAKVATLKKQPALVLGADARILPSRLKKVIRELENMVVYIENSLAEKNPEKNPPPSENNPPPPEKNPPPEKISPLQKKNRPTFPHSLLAESSRRQDTEMQDADKVIRDDKKKRWNSTMEDNRSRESNQQVMTKKDRGSDQPNKRTDTGNNSRGANLSRAEAKQTQMTNQKVIANKDRVPDQPTKTTDKGYSSKDGVSSKDIKNQTPAIDRQKMTNKERAPDQPMEGTDKGDSSEDEDSSDETSESFSDGTSQGSSDESDWTSSDE